MFCRAMKLVFSVVIMRSMMTTLRLLHRKPSVPPSNVSIRTVRMLVIWTEGVEPT
jgi:hypothetical protein